MPSSSPSSEDPSLNGQGGGSWLGPLSPDDPMEPTDEPATWLRAVAQLLLPA